MAEKRKKTPKTNGEEQTPKSRLSPADLRHFQQLLLQKRTELLGNVSKIEGEALRQSRLDASGDLSSMPIHMADLGTDNFEQEFSLDLMDSERRLLVEMEDALHRIETGTYGICEGTGKPISKARLEAQPWARYSVEYAKMVEEGRGTEGQ
ncbi:MAG: TraR/DksA C4-type zinc finger protein [Phycisphaerae bacterium]|nr:TraR/DksA C4-type zinc finger protein [Phycisphaerae bacterium]